MKWMALLAALCMALPQTPGPFRSSVEVIEVAVLVRDEGGRLISDLAQTDFELVDDGAPQAIIGFSRVSMPAGPSPGDRSATPPVPRDVASNEQVRQSRIFVLVLDALHVSPRRTRVVRSAARQFVERHMGPADLAAVFAPGRFLAPPRISRTTRRGSSRPSNSSRAANSYRRPWNATKRSGGGRPSSTMEWTPAISSARIGPRR